jgi:hypothetical protein
MVKRGRQAGHGEAREAGRAWAWPGKGQAQRRTRVGGGPWCKQQQGVEGPGASSSRAGAAEDPLSRASLGGWCWGCKQHQANGVWVGTPISNPIPPMEWRAQGAGKWGMGSILSRGGQYSLVACPRCRQGPPWTGQSKDQLLSAAGTRQGPPWTGVRTLTTEMTRRGGPWPESGSHSPLHSCPRFDHYQSI